MKNLVKTVLAAIFLAVGGLLGAVSFDLADCSTIAGPQVCPSFGAMAVGIGGLLFALASAILFFMTDPKLLSPDEREAEGLVQDIHNDA